MSKPIQAMYFDGTYPQGRLPEEQGLRGPPSTVEDAERARHDNSEMEPLSEVEVKYAKALTALRISPEFIKRTSRTKRVSSGGSSLTSLQRRRFDAEIQAAVNQLKKGPVQGETPRTIAENLVEDLGDELNTNVIERGVKYDLAGGNRKILGKWKKDHEGYEEWKLNIHNRKYAIDEDGEQVPTAKTLYDTHQRHAKHIRPRLDTVEYMSKTIEDLWREAGTIG